MSTSRKSSSRGRDFAPLAVEGRVEATHTGTLVGPAGGVPATGLSLDMTFASLYRIEGGQIVSVHAYWDQVEFMTQLGLMPAQAVA